MNAIDDNLSQKQHLPDEDLVKCPHCHGQYRRRGLTRHIRYAHGNNLSSTQEDNNNDEVIQSNFIQNLFNRGFGATLVNSDGNEENEWHMRWRYAMKLKGRQYILPQGSIGRQFVDILSREIQAVTNGMNTTEKIFFLCATILQKDKMIRIGSDIRRLLKKRMEMWNNGLYDELLQEATRCDNQLKTSQQQYDDEHKIRIFSRMVLKGKLRDATRWITDRYGGGVLMMPDTILPDGQSVFQVLQSKHPSQMIPDENTFLNCEHLPVLIDIDVTSEHIEKMARCLHGSAGPSGTDADQWKNMLLRFGAHSAHLRESVASLTRLLANGIVNWCSIRALLAKRGIALDKCPGVRPIGIGEVLQRLCAKTMAFITSEDLQDICGSDQLCTGTKAGIEGAIHAMNDLFDEDDQNGILLVDANNAFNSLSRPLVLWNCRILWPRCSRFIFNTYRGYAKIMFKNSDQVILSREGTTQGDPLAMLMYAVGLLPLIKKLKNDTWTQNWYADDSACLGKLRQIRDWFDQLQNEGPKWGYYPEPRKSILIVKPGHEEEAKIIFRDLNVKIVTSHRFLGGILGTPEEKKQFIKEKVKHWVECIKQMSNAAQKSPQAAYTAFTKSLQNEWAFLQRVTEGYNDEYQDLTKATRTYFTPNLFDQEISTIEHEIFTLPVRLGGLNIQDSSKRAGILYNTSRKCTERLLLSIKNGQVLNNNDHVKQIKQVNKEMKFIKDNVEKQESERLLMLLPEEKRRPLMRIINGNASQWLAVIPIAADNMDLSPNQFRDALALRYNKPLKNLPLKCDGCESDMNLTHALNCKKGGLVKHGHDQLRDHCAAIANIAWNGVGIEPILRESNPTNKTSALYADFKVNGVWEAERVVFFDNRIINADAPSYASQDWPTIAKNAAQQKHIKYDKAAEDVRGSFTPLISSADGVIHKEFAIFHKRASNVLSRKWKKPYSQVI